MTLSCWLGWVPFKVTNAVSIDNNEYHLPLLPSFDLDLGQIKQDRSALYGIAGLIAHGNEIIATLLHNEPPYQDIISGHKYNADKVDNLDSSEILFVSNDTAYSFIYTTDKLIEHKRQGNSFKSTVVAKTNKKFSSISVGNNNNIFVSSFTGNHLKEAVNSTLSIYRDRAFKKLIEFDGRLEAITVSHDNKKIYGIFYSYKTDTHYELIEILLQDKVKGYKVLARIDGKGSGVADVKCDKQGNIYVLWKESLKFTTPKENLTPSSLLHYT
ncbi:hypothetical protein DSO57_1033663 [Entomophthora muscae]|uniref:Uncharacterized protein n=1 Tax=Entomophthora muscae TaxID=34485 RepID=A0ACC2SD33_9FUNG|nr:hypothetical protein DSO57_1033663 [Entomophthora muscae]